MRNQRWIYVVLVLVGVVLGIGIAGVPSQHQDPPIHFSGTTASTSTTTSIPPP